MSTIAQSVLVDASLAEVWGYYFEPRGWPAWVDGFAHVAASDGYPQPGGSLRWSSIPAGRGEVTEHVLEHEPRRLHRVAFRDPSSAGELRTAFAIEGERTMVSQRLEYRLVSAGPFGWLTDRLFIRSQMRGSMRRSLDRLALEVGER
ncbi:MAG TPA: SRPBCC family protein [Solirubrobacterales bacterium]